MTLSTWKILIWTNYAPGSFYTEQSRIYGDDSKKSCFIECICDKKQTWKTVIEEKQSLLWSVQYQCSLFNPCHTAHSHVSYCFLVFFSGARWKYIRNAATNVVPLLRISETVDESYFTPYDRLVSDWLLPRHLPREHRNEWTTGGISQLSPG